MSITQALSNSSGKSNGAASPKSNGTASPKSNGIIVIADNNSASMDRIAAAFEKVGWRVGTARNGDEAIDIADTGKVNAIMLDVSRPEIHGCDICRKLLDLGKTIPTMMITGCMNKADPSGPVNIEGTTIKLVTGEEVEAFSKSVQKRFVWHGDKPDIVVSRTPGHRHHATPACARQLEEPNQAVFQPV